ncbi:hypothetical protein M885DRAFT_559594 [Pelagophyceae sp. CCMP2097]|nr:hypothetical protein M885DRAFT_559594 [Pelagophyceae sp. CCMP2097]
MHLLRCIAALAALARAAAVPARLGNIGVAALSLGTSPNPKAILGRRTGLSDVELWMPIGAPDKVRAFFRNKYKLNAAAESERTAVVHLRCGDVPCRRHENYHLPQASFWNQPALWEAIRAREIEHVVLYTIPANATAPHAGYVNRAPAAEAEAAFLSAQLLIAPVPSTFLFLAGLTNPQGDFTGPFVDARYRKGPGATDIAALAKAVPWHMQPEPPVWHPDVSDYHADIAAKRFGMPV